MASLGSSLVSTSGLLLVTPKTVVGYTAQPNPILNGQPPATGNTFLFHYEGEQTVEFESDITDHYIETNSAVQDQISIKPIQVTTHGFIGDLNDVLPGSLQPFATAVTNVLSNISAYNPELTISTLNAYNEAFAAYQTAQSLVTAALNKFGGSVPGMNTSTQSSVYAQFFSWWQQRALFTIQTPWTVLQNMAILSLRSYQDETTRTITDFQLTFKQLNFVTVQSPTTNAISGSALNSTGRAAIQGSSTVNLGTNLLTPSTTAFSPSEEVA